VINLLCLILQAVSYQKKAVIVCERVFGVDHPDTIIAFVRKLCLKEARKGF